MFRLLLLCNGWHDCVKILYAIGVPSVTAYAVVTDGVSLHVLRAEIPPQRASVSQKRLDRLCSRGIYPAAMLG